MGEMARLLRILEEDVSREELDRRATVVYPDGVDMARVLERADRLGRRPDRRSEATRGCAADAGFQTFGRWCVAQHDCGPAAWIASELIEALAIRHDRSPDEIGRLRPEEACALWEGAALPDHVLDREGGTAPGAGLAAHDALQLLRASRDALDEATRHDALYTGAGPAGQAVQERCRHVALADFWSRITPLRRPWVAVPPSLLRASRATRVGRGRPGDPRRGLLPRPQAAPRTLADHDVG